MEIIKVECFLQRKGNFIDRLLGNQNEVTVTGTLWQIQKATELFYDGKLKPSDRVTLRINWRLKSGKSYQQVIRTSVLFLLSETADELEKTFAALIPKSVTDI